MNFSLLEVNLAILIIALLFSVTTKTIDFHRVTNLHAYIAEVSTVRRDVREFRQLYDFVPGDFPLAYQLWDNPCVYFATGEFLCNGDGDGKIIDQSEGYLAWVHLNQLRKQFFTIKKDIVKSRAIIGQNVRGSKVFNRAGFQILGDTRLNNNYFSLEDVSVNFLRVAGEKDSGNLLNSVFTPKDLYFIDKKIDDGFPLRGVAFADSGNDAENECIIDAENFNLSFKEVLCYQQIALD